MFALLSPNNKFNSALLVYESHLFEKLNHGFAPDRPHLCTMNHGSHLYARLLPLFEISAFAR
jgi:hypothetical protein